MSLTDDIAFEIEMKSNSLMNQFNQELMHID